MLHKTITAVLTITALGLVVSGPARAHWAHGPGHGWTPGWHHHWHGGFWPGVGFGWPYYDYPFLYAEEGYGGCHVARQRVMTRQGWRFRRVDVCE
jgi:hypothetical protein